MYPNVTNPSLNSILSNARDYFVPHFDNNPQCLQHKIYFNITYFLGKRGKEGLRELQKDSFELCYTDQGRAYYTMKYNEVTKKVREMTAMR